MSENPGNVIDQDQTVPLTHLNRLTAERECRVMSVLPPDSVAKDFLHPERNIDSKNRPAAQD
jgi:hypothetical protein